MSPCCLAAAVATAALTAIVVVGLSAFVLVTDGFGLALLICTVLALVLQDRELIGPCPNLLYALCVLLAGRAVVLLATTRRSLVIAVWEIVRPRAAQVVTRVAEIGRQRLGRSHRHHSGHCAVKPPTVYGIAPRPERRNEV